MKKYVLILIVLFSLGANSQSVIGAWERNHVSDNGEALKSVVIFSDGWADHGRWPSDDHRSHYWKCRYHFGKLTTWKGFKEFVSECAWTKPKKEDNLEQYSLL